MKFIATIIILLLNMSINISAQSLKINYQEVLTMTMQLNQNGVLTTKTVSTTTKDSQLTYKNGESFYEAVSEAKTETPSENSWLKMDMMISDPKVYKNKKKNELIAEDFILDKKFLVVDTLFNYKWQITNEADTILGLKCFKSTCQIPIGVVTAWFCPDIPVNDGPLQYGGLPGLILKLDAQNNVITATGIQQIDDKQFGIEKPKNGKRISRKKFDELMTKKMKQMDMPADGSSSVKVKIIK
jgi:GLPGLI family protein